jgi:predicted HAD superfamily Cof-like phosphohydrolase
MTHFNRTHFELVGEFHDTFGHPLRTENYTDCFTTEQNLIPFRISLMREELDEFNDAYGKKDVIEMADALCDLAYVTYGAGHSLGINIDNVLQELNVSLTPTQTETKTNTLGKLDAKTNQWINEYTDIVVQNEYEMLNRVLENFQSVATKSQNFTKMRFWLGYVIKYVYDLGHVLGFNMDLIFREVHRSNMTKVCDNIEDANQSVKFYQTDSRYSDPQIKTKGKYFVVFDAGTTKILKNHKWENPNIKQFLNPCVCVSHS